jgi:hypothetical protein
MAKVYGLSGDPAIDRLLKRVNQQLRAKAERLLKEAWLGTGDLLNDQNLKGSQRITPLENDIGLYRQLVRLIESYNS